MHFPSRLRWVLVAGVGMLAIGGLGVFMLWPLPSWLSRRPFIADHAAHQKAIADTRASSAAVLVAIGGLLTAGGAAAGIRGWGTTEQPLALGSRGQLRLSQQDSGPPMLRFGGDWKLPTRETVSSPKRIAS